MAKENLDGNNLLNNILQVNRLVRQRAALLITAVIVCWAIFGLAISKKKKTDEFESAIFYLEYLYEQDSLSTYILKNDFEAVERLWKYPDYNELLLRIKSGKYNNKELILQAIKDLRDHKLQISGFKNENNIKIVGVEISDQMFKYIAATILFVLFHNLVLLLSYRRKLLKKCVVSRIALDEIGWSLFGLDVKLGNRYTSGYFRFISSISLTLFLLLPVITALMYVEPNNDVTEFRETILAYNLILSGIMFISFLTTVYFENLIYFRDFVKIYFARKLNHGYKVEFGNKLLWFIVSFSTIFIPYIAGFNITIKEDEDINYYFLIVTPLLAFIHPITLLAFSWKRNNITHAFAFIGVISLFYWIIVSLLHMLLALLTDQFYSHSDYYKFVNNALITLIVSLFISPIFLFFIGKFKSRKS